MNTLTWLSVLSVILSIVLFNTHEINHGKTTIQTLNKLNQQLNITGRQRYLSQRLLTQISDQPAHNGSMTLGQLVPDNYLKGSTRLLNYLSQQDDWRKTQQLKHKLALFEVNVNIFWSDYANTKIDELDKLTFKRWSNETITLLDEIQNLNVVIANALAIKFSQHLNYVTLVNTLSFCVLFGIIFLRYHHHHKVISAKSARAFEHLKAQKEELLNTKKLLLSLMEDLHTERKSALVISDDLASANRLLQLRNREMEQFIYTVSHDLKSPLVTIGAFSQTLMSQLSDTLTPKQLHKLNRIQTNVQQMETLLEDLLQLTKVLHQGIEIEKIDTLSALKDQLNALESMLTEVDAKIEINEPLLALNVNKRLFSQCINNLISNAVKYRATTRQLTISFSTKQNENEILLLVEDNGMGIEKKYHEKVFRLFERLDHGEGTGVGLAIVRAAIEKHGGKISLESKLDKGSIFTLHLPLP